MFFVIAGSYNLIRAEDTIIAPVELGNISTPDRIVCKSVYAQRIYSPASGFIDSVDLRLSWPFGWYGARTELSRLLDQCRESCGELLQKLLCGWLYDHTGLISDQELITPINNILENRPDDIPQGISTSSAGCFAPPITSEQVLFSSHSSVQLHIFDSQNRHGGPLEHGDVEVAIPGSQYFAIGGNSLAYVQAGDTCRVELRTTEAGAAKFKVETLRNLETENKIVSLALLLVSSSQTLAELALTTAQDDLTLRLDDDGGGAFDTYLQPNAVLAAEEATDSTPPILTMPNIPSEVILHTWIAESTNYAQIEMEPHQSS